MNPIYKHSKKQILLLLSCLGTFVLTSSCNKYLDTLPDDRAQVTTIEDIKELITSGYPHHSYIPMFEIRSDNAQDKGKLRSEDRTEAEIYEWKQVTSVYQDTPNAFWRGSYNGVSVANHALRALDESFADSKDEAVLEARAEAHMVRAYNMFMLAQAFTLPYNPNTASSNLGLPYPTKPETKVFEDYSRGKLDQLYKLILEDFNAGIENIGSQYNAPKFHFTPTSSMAFGVRLYRVMGDWDKVISYGEDLLGPNKAMLLRKYATDYTSLTYSEKEHRWGIATEPCNFMVQVALSKWARNFYRSRFGFTGELVDKIFKSKTFLGTTMGMSIYGKASKGVSNIPKFYEHFKVTNQATGSGYIYTALVLFSAEEVLFDLAEAYCMQRKYDKANECLQAFVSTWFKSYSPANPKFTVTKEKILDFYKDDTRQFKPFYSLDTEQEAYIKAITDLKQMAFYHEGQRWMDVRQYNLEVVHQRLSNEDKTVENIVFKSGDPRVAFPLPENVLGFGLKQNPGY